MTTPITMIGPVPAVSPIARIALAVLACTCFAGTADASLYTLDSETFDQRFALPDDGFHGALNRFETPFDDPIAWRVAASGTKPSESAYLTLALHAAADADTGAERTARTAPIDTLTSLQAGDVVAAAPRRQALADAPLSNPGTYQGNLWTLMTASLNGPSGNSLLGFAQANFSEIPFEPPASVPLPNSAVLFGAALLTAAAWRLRSASPR